MKLKIETAREITADDYRKITLDLMIMVGLRVDAERTAVILEDNGFKVDAIAELGDEGGTIIH